jgi:hypothetical protein
VGIILVMVGKCLIVPFIAHLQTPVFRHIALITGKEKKEYQELP